MDEMRIQDRKIHSSRAAAAPASKGRTQETLGFVLAFLLAALICVYSAGRSFADVAVWERYSDLGRTALQSENYDEAQAMFEAALREAEQLSPWDVRVGRSLNDLAATYYAQGQHDVVAELLTRSLRVIEVGVGQEHPDVAQVLKNLAAVQYLLEAFPQAEENLVRAVGIWEKTYGRDNELIASTLNNLAGIYEAQSKHSEAADALERSMRIWEVLQGPDADAVTESRRQLAELRRVHGLLPPAAPEPAPQVQVAATPQQPPQQRAPIPGLNRIQVTSPSQRADYQPAAPQQPVQQAINPVPPQPAGQPVPQQVARQAALPAASPQNFNQTQSTGSTVYLEPAPSAVAQSAPRPGAPARVQIAASPAQPAVKVHLASFRSASNAEDNRSRLRDSFRSLLLGNQELWVERVELGARGSFYRVMAGPFNNASAAQGFCSRLPRQDCFLQPQ